MKTIAVLVGSLRAGSTNLALARALEGLAAPRLRFVYPDLAGLPHYNEDLWQDPPAAVLDLKQRIEHADAVLFVTPEYNRSVPGVLTDALAWASRPYGQNSWQGKPVAIVGTSPGAIGTAAAQSHLRSIVPVLGMTLLGQPEVYLQTRPGLINDRFAVTDEPTRTFLSGWTAAFAAHIDRLAPAATRRLEPAD